MPRWREPFIDSVLLCLGTVALLSGALYWWQHAQAERAFEADLARGKPALARVETVEDRGRDHLSPGETYAYPDPFPTSGPHDPQPTKPGFYTDPQPPTRLVHALEHGNIVIYYGPSAETLDTLKQWVGLFHDPWDGIVVVPHSALRDEIVLTAWTKQLRLKPFDPAAGAAFVDGFRGRGPENPVR